MNWKELMKLNYHNVQLQHDLINTLGNAITPLPEDELIHKVTNRGFKHQRIYVDDEILEVLEYLVRLGFVKKTGDKYEWFE